MNNLTLNIGSTFSGIGAFEYALIKKNIDHNIIFASDNDKFCKQSYFENFKINEQSWYDDVKDIKGGVYKNKIDILTGGTPCQSFSMVGKRKGLNDTRGTLFYDFARLIDEIKPKCFIFENVKGLLNHDKGNTWKTIKNVLKSDLQYDIHYKVLNARDFGIPQNRERIFVVGFKKRNKNFKFPNNVKLDSTMQDFLEDNFDSKYFLSKKGVDFVTRKKNLDKRYTQINGDVALCQKRNQQFNWHGDFIIDHQRDIPEKYYLSEKVKRYVLSSGTKNFFSKPETDLKVARTLVSTMHKMHRAGVDNYITSNLGIRKLTPRECLRLMGFGDDFKITVSDTQMYRQAGNSIVVNVLVALTEEILNSWDI
jgi:DNA (cytosine-5)-methyltransferase 1